MIARALTLLTVGLVALVAALFPHAHAQQTVNGVTIAAVPSCTNVHKDVAVNTAAITLTTATPPLGQYVYVCGWDYQVAGDGTGTAILNALWTTTNLNGYAVQFSTAVGAEVGTSGTFIFALPLKAQGPGFPVTVISPALAAHSTYSANLYYYIGP